MMTDVEIVSRAIKIATKANNKTLVMAIRQDINVSMLSFEDIVRSRGLKEMVASDAVKVKA
jgi:hypothetical protein